MELQFGKLYSYCYTIYIYSDPFITDGCEGWTIIPGHGAVEADEPFVILNRIEHDSPPAEICRILTTKGAVGYVLLTYPEYLRALNDN